MSVDRETAYRELTAALTKLNPRSATDQWMIEKARGWLADADIS